VSLPVSENGIADQGHAIHCYIDLLEEMARPTRFERVVSTFGGQRSIYAARRGMALSTNRKNRVLRAPATNDSCETSEGDPGGSPFAFWSPFRRDRVLRVQDLNLLRYHSS
jgi:hypothetical protein